MNINANLSKYVRIDAGGVRESKNAPEKTQVKIENKLTNIEHYNFEKSYISKWGRPFDVAK